MTTSSPGTGRELRTLVTAQGTVEMSLEEVPVPEPAPDEVIVRVEAAPINPSDLGLLFAGADMATAAPSGPPGHPVLTATLSRRDARPGPEGRSARQAGHRPAACRHGGDRSTASGPAAGASAAAYPASPADSAAAALGAAGPARRAPPVRIIKRTLKEIQYRPHLLDSCLAATGLEIEPW